MVGPHVLPYCHGSGGNGKGVFLETCVKVLGGYATTAPAGFLMAKVHQGHETEVARLAGARMVLCSEVNDDDRFDEARVKLLTGGDTLTARFMQQDHFTFTPTHQLWAMGNHQPHVRAGGRSFWRRLRLIPFQHEVPTDQVIDDLQGILAGEHGPAVLSWIIDGAVAYARDGLIEPDSVKAAPSGYERDQDTVSRFIEDMCLLGGGEHVQTKVTTVRSAYEAWCHESGDEPVSAKAFGMALSRAGVGSKRTKTARFYTNLHLVDGDENASPDGEIAAQGWFQ
jgi:putative DNA primase/helicase